MKAGERLLCGAAMATMLTPFFLDIAPERLKSIGRQQLMKLLGNFQTSRPVDPSPDPADALSSSVPPVVPNATDSPEDVLLMADPSPDLSR